MIISELFKLFYYNNKPIQQLNFWQDITGHEVDCIIEDGFQLYPIEIKASMTVNSDFFKELKYWHKITKGDPRNAFIIYAGNEVQERLYGNVVGWKRLNELFKKIY